MTCLVVCYAPALEPCNIRRGKALDSVIYEVGGMIRGGGGDKLKEKSR